jgi:hypothetical protein
MAWLRVRHCGWPSSEWFPLLTAFCGPFCVVCPRRNLYHCNIDELIVKQVMNTFVSNGMKDAGYEYVNIDDCAWYCAGCAAAVAADALQLLRLLLLLLLLLLPPSPLL